MRGIIKNLLIAVALLPLVVSAQVSTSPTSIAGMDPYANLTAISATKVNVLYIGLDNPITIAVCDVKCNKISATIDNGSMVQQADGSWIVKVTGGLTAKISVFVEKDGRNQLFKEQSFRVLRVPNPVACLNGVTSGSIAKAAIVGNPVLSAILPNFLFEGINFSVTSYTFSVIDSKGGIKSFKITGTSLDRSSLEALNKASVGDKLAFENIKVVGPDGATRMIERMELVIE
jgi:hypothetical protein